MWPLVALLACAVLAVATGCNTASGDAQEATSSKVTMVFTVLAIAPLFHAFNCRSERASIFKLGLFSNASRSVSAVVVIVMSRPRTSSTES